MASAPERQLEDLIQILAIWLAKIRISNAVDFLDINKMAEGVSLRLLNLIYPFELRDLNEEKKNFPAVDLGDREKGIAFQVTSKTGAAKIRDGLEKFSKHKLREQFPNGIRFFLLTEKRPKFQADFSDDDANFDAIKHVFTIEQIVSELKILVISDPDRLEHIYVEVMKILKPRLPGIIGDYSNVISILKTLTDTEFFMEFIQDNFVQKLSQKADVFSSMVPFGGTNKKDFDKVFFPTKLQIAGRIKIVKKETRQFLPEGILLISGEAGSGKTMLVKRIFLNALKFYDAFPIIINFRLFNKEKSETILEYLCKRYFGTYSKERSYALEIFFQQGNCIFIFDGYDELYLSQGDSFRSKFEDFFNLFPDNKFVLTTRKGADIEHWQEINMVRGEVLPLDENGIFEFVEQQLREEPEDSEAVIKNLNHPLNKERLKYLKNPLFLSMYIFNLHFSYEIPTEREVFFRDVFEALYSKHDRASKLPFRRKREAELFKQEYEQILKILAFRTLFEKKFPQFNFDDKRLNEIISSINLPDRTFFDVEKVIHDFNIGMGILQSNEALYQFPHRSMQDYFAARFIKKELTIQEKANVYQYCVLPYSTFDPEFNLLHLCLELDPEYVSQSFIRPMIQPIIEFLSGKKAKQNFMSLIDFQCKSVGSMNFSSYTFEPLFDFISEKPSPLNEIFLKRGLPFFYEKNLFGALQTLVKEKWTPLITTEIEEGKVFQSSQRILDPEWLKLLEEGGVFDVVAEFVEWLKQSFDAFLLRVEKKREGTSAIVSQILEGRGATR